MQYEMTCYARANFGDIADRKQREHAAEVDLVHAFFERRADGVFVEIGANDPRHFSQTWHLEQHGWTGLLVEPLPSMCRRLRSERPRSTVVEAACSAPERTGRATFYEAEDPLHSSLEPAHVDHQPTIVASFDVEVVTADAILEAHAPGRVDFVSIDVEGNQLDVLRGLDLDRHAPRLVLIEDHLTDYRTHFHMKRHGYRLVKRTGLNSWYVPKSAPFDLTTAGERFKLWRKVWLRTIVRGLRARLRRRLVRR